MAETVPDDSDKLPPIRRDLMPLLAGELARHEAAKFDPTMSTVELGDAMLRDAVRERASDVHLEPCSEKWRVRLRIDGCVFEGAELPRDLGVRLLRHLKTQAGLDTSPAFIPQDARHTTQLAERLIDVRLTVVPSIGGEKMAIRMLDRQSIRRRVDTLGFAESQVETIRQWLEHAHGMLLVGGPTGSGKTTTLYSLLHELKLFQKSIATIEDPVEYQIDGITQMQVHLKHGMTFAEATKAMMRADPDFLLVGEIRERESARAALDAAARGRVLMSTMHCRDAVTAVRVLRMWGAAGHEIAESLDVVISQRLVRVLCPACRRMEDASDADRRWFEMMRIPLPQHTWKAVGCAECRGLGYVGRTGVFEIWVLDEEDYRQLLGQAGEMALRKSLAARGHRTLLDDGLDKADRGITSLDELKSMVTGYAPRLASAAGWRVPAEEEGVENVDADGDGGKHVMA